jgi:hypothetical protein
MKRTTLNFIIDAVGFAGFVFLTATGVLVRYVLPPGSGHHTTVWGLDRHAWGAVHFWIAVGFLGVLALHVILHWRWIVCVIRGRPRQGSGARLALGLFAAMAVVAVAVAPLGSPVDRAEATPPQEDRSSTHEHDTAGIRGRMTLAEIERSTGVPAAHLIERLGMPRDVSLDTGVAKLGAQFGFDIDDAREVVRAYASPDPS